MLKFKSQSYLGIVCGLKDEKLIMARVNAFLLTLSRTTSKAKNKSLLDSYLPFVFKHFYWNLNKDTGTFVSIVPNQDIEGKWMEASYMDCAWLLAARIDLSGWERIGELTPEKIQTTQDFLSNLIANIGFETKLIDETDNLLAENRW